MPNSWMRTFYSLQAQSNSSSCIEFHLGVGTNLVKTRSAKVSSGSHIGVRLHWGLDTAPSYTLIVTIVTCCGWKELFSRSPAVSLRIIKFPQCQAPSTAARLLGLYIKVECPSWNRVLGSLYHSFDSRALYSHVSKHFSCGGLSRQCCQRTAGRYDADRDPPLYDMAEVYSGEFMYHATGEGCH